MPLSIRGRIAIVCGGLLVAMLVVFGSMLRAIQNAQVRAESRVAAEAEVRGLAAQLAIRIRDVEAAMSGPGDSLTRWIATLPGEGYPVATPRLKALVEGVPDYVYLLARDGRVIYNSYAVRALTYSQRFPLDSIVVGLPAGGSILMDTQGAGYFARTDQRVHVVPLTTGELLLYAITAESHPTGINRVVAGRIFQPARIAAIDFVAPLLILLPLAVLAAIGAAYLIAHIAFQPVETLIADVEAISDGRSLHRRLALDTDAPSPLGRLADTLNAMFQRLETSFGALRRFTADASHELKTPLTVLRADVERAMGLRANRPEQLVALEEALAETTRMADLVESLLTLARADEGRFDLYREPVDLSALARDVYETAVLLGEPSRISVTMRDAEPLTVSGDRNRLRQLFLNLVTNAIKYTPPRGQVELALARIDGMAQFSVRDSGIGIAAADLERVFDRFWRADQARSRGGERGGFGLGLAISQYIAQAHGGSLAVRSRLGRGSTFTVSLPLAPDAGSE